MRSFLADHNFGGLDTFGVVRLVENFSGAYPVDLHHFASGQVGCVKLVQGVVFRNARKHSKVQIGTAGQHSASQLIAVTLNIHLILYALVSSLAAGVPSKTDWSAL